MIQITASRSRLLSISVLWASASVMLVLFSILLVSHAKFQDSVFQSLAVDMSLVIIALPICIAALLACWKTLEYGTIALWPGFVGIKFDAHHLYLIRGPYGRRDYESKFFDIRYPFELSADEKEGHVEAFLPKQVQFETMLPHIHYMDEQIAVERLIQKLIRRSNEEIAPLIRPMIQQWQAHESRT